MITQQYKIPDKQLKAAIDGVEQLAQAGKNGNFEVIKGEIRKDDYRKFDEGKRYIDEKNKRIVFRIGNKLYHSSLTELT